MTERWGFRRTCNFCLHDVQAAVLRMSREQQRKGTPGTTKGEDNRIRRRLLNFLNETAGTRRCQFGNDSMYVIKAEHRLEGKLLDDVVRDGSFEVGCEPADGLNEIRIVSACFDRLNKGAAHNDAVRKRGDASGIVRRRNAKSHGHGFSGFLAECAHVAFDGIPLSQFRPR